MKVTEDRAAMARLLVIAQLIYSLKEVPADHVYAQVMQHIDLYEFDCILLTLVNAGLVKRTSNHLLTWTGPGTKEWAS